MIIRTVSYPDVALLEHLLTIDGIDTQRISEWMHFSTNLYPIYSQQACNALNEMGLETPFKLDDMASYGLYVARIEGLKMYALPKGFLRLDFLDQECSNLVWSDLNEKFSSPLQIVSGCCNMGSWMASWQGCCY